MKIILDINVLISLSLGGGPTLQRIGAAWLAGEVQVIISEELLDEYAGVANRPHLLARFETADRVQAFVRDLRVAGELVSIHDPYPDAPDEDDFSFRACACRKRRGARNRGSGTSRAATV